MHLPVRCFILKICQLNWQNGKFVPLITSTILHQNRLLSPHFYHRFFATTVPSDVDKIDGETANKKITVTAPIVGAWHCANCHHLNWPQQRICKKCTVGAPTEEQKVLLQQLVWVCPNCTARTSGDYCWSCELAHCTVHKGFWVCSNCAWRNIPVHLSCRKCIRGRPTEDQQKLIQQARWVCAKCRHHNFTDDCFKCGAPKSEQLPSGLGGESLPDGSWYCVSCCFLNFPNYLKCRLCRKGAPSAEQLNAIQNARWICGGCGYSNYESNLMCYHCKMAKPTKEEQISTFPHWVCPSCSTSNFPVHLSCRRCIRGRPTEEARQLIQHLRWVCAKCKHHNFTEECFKCGTTKSNRLPAAVGGQSLPDGSWYCVSCWFLNYPNYLVCRQCREGTVTDEQLSAIGKSRWECSDCGILNYATNSTCYKCTAPMPKPS